MRKLEVRSDQDRSANRHLFSVDFIACLTCPSIAGALIQKDGARFLFTQAFGRSTFMGGSLTLIAARVAKNGLNLRIRI